VLISGVDVFRLGDFCGTHRACGGGEKDKHVGCCVNSSVAL
jgi:hypothetical protein